MINVVNERVQAGATEIQETVFDRSAQFLKAAGMLIIYEKGRDITQALHRASACILTESPRRKQPMTG